MYLHKDWLDIGVVGVVHGTHEMRVRGSWGGPRKSDGNGGPPTNGARCSPLTGQMVVMSYVHTYIDVMMITSVNIGLWTEDITSRRTHDQDRRDAHGTKVT